MTLFELNQLIDNKAFLSLFSAVVGGLIGNLIALLRSSIKTIEYTVSHDRIAFSTNDAVFGLIRVTWQGHDVTNLFSTRVTLENQTGKDFTNLKVKVYTNDTMILGEQTEIPGTTYVLNWTEEYKHKIAVLPGSNPTSEQFRTYNHSREYLIPVLNRGQRAVLTYLTSVSGNTHAPGAWLDMLHEGVKVQYRQVVPQIHGVPVLLALYIGAVTCVAVLAVTSFTISEPWAAAAICMTTGLFAQSLGAVIYRCLRLVKTIISR